jgi:integrase
MAKDMKRIQAENHPKAGDIIKVEPLREKKDIRNIKKFLADKPLDLAYFTVGINSNLRASDILQIKYCHAAGFSAGDTFQIREKKTGKLRTVTLNDEMEKVLKNLFKFRKYEPEDFIFTGQRGVWTVPSVNNKVKAWCKSINLKGNYGSHTLRKTWGYHQFRTFGVSLPFLMACFNHRKESQTLEYLCIEDAEIKNIFMNSL